MNIDEVIQQPGQLEEIQKEAVLGSIHVSIPGEIVSFDADTRTAVIQPTVRMWRRTKNPPLLLDVPVFFPGGILFDVNPGDGCLVVFADRCIDAWFQNGGVSTPVSARMHDYSDGFAFVGFSPKKDIQPAPTIDEKFAAKKDTVLDTTLSHGRKEDSTIGEYSMAYGSNLEAAGKYSQAFGLYSSAIGDYSHAEGNYARAAGTGSHAEGAGYPSAITREDGTSYVPGANGNFSHVEGYRTYADRQAHAEGFTTMASGQASHTEGYNTTASGTSSHAEGYQTKATQTCAHSEGYNTRADASYSHAEGYRTIANRLYMHAGGRYNAQPKAGELFAIGNGIDEEHRSNAFTVTDSGEAKIGGTLTIGSTTITEAQLQGLLALLS